ncbi:replication protein RepA [Fimbriiglobus ruber]|uniref:replication protein RepA n=1 Tax=Fimbriiglobus ruber TaxID=1908690 RepID=UPI000B4BDDDA
MVQDFGRLTLTRHQQKLLDTSTAIRTAPADRIDFLHSVQCQCGIPYRNPGDDVREWDRKQGIASLRIEAGSAIDPRTGEFTKLGLPYGEKPRLVLIHLATEAVRTGSPVVDVEESMTAFARSLGLETNGQQLRGSRSNSPAWRPRPSAWAWWRRDGPSRSTPSSSARSICGSRSRPTSGFCGRPRSG